MDLKVDMGKGEIQNLTLYTDITIQSVKLYTSHPLLLWFPIPFD